MGGFNPLSQPKIPAPPPLPAAPRLETVDDSKLFETRLRRQRASGTSGNVVSSLRSSTSDEEASARISKLLG